MSRRRTTVAAFSMSFLDLLCCGLGAMLLLFILSEQRQKEELVRQQAEVMRVDERLTDVRAETGPEALERIAAWADAAADRVSPSPALGQAGADVAGQIGLHGDPGHLVIVVDVSGSMSSFLPDEPAFADAPAHLRTPGGKWEFTVALVAETLLRAADPGFDDGLVRFRIHRLSDDTPERSVTEPIHPLTGDWVVNDPAGVAAAVAALRAVEPAGGSNHHAALEHALAGSVAAADPILEPPAETILLVTDGLPNHGPVGANPPDPRVHPAPAADGSGGLVSAASRFDRRSRVLDMLSRTIRAAPATPRIHVITLPWPDDTTLVQFAIRLAAPTGGSVVSVPPPLPDPSGS